MQSQRPPKQVANNRLAHVKRVVGGVAAGACLRFGGASQTRASMVILRDNVQHFVLRLLAGQLQLSYSMLFVLCLLLLLPFQR